MIDTCEATPLDMTMMTRALSLAATAAESGEVPIAAVVYRGEDILAEAANDREASADPVGHAELRVARRAGGF